MDLVSIVSNVHIHLAGNRTGKVCPGSSNGGVLDITGIEACRADRVIQGKWGRRCFSCTVTTGVDNSGIIDIDFCAVIEQLYLQTVNFIPASSVIEADILVAGKRCACIFKAEADMVHLAGAFQWQVNRHLWTIYRRSHIFDSVSGPSPHWNSVIGGFEPTGGGCYSYTTSLKQASNPSAIDWEPRKETRNTQWAIVNITDFNNGHSYRISPCYRWIKPSYTRDNRRINHLINIRRTICITIQ